MTRFSVLIRCNAGYAAGYGHVSRCLALARAFAALGSSGIAFVLNSSEAAPLVKAQEHDVIVLDAADPDTGFVAAVGGRRPDIVVLDARPPHSLAALRAVREKVRLLAVLDDLSGQRLLADVIYLPPVPAVDRADWTGFAGVKRVGLRWMLTGVHFTPPAYRKPVAPYRLLMTMGGSDPWGYTQRLAPIFADICHEEKMSFGVVIGPGFKERSRQIAKVERLPGRPLVFDDPADMGEVYGWCDAAVLPVCVSAYELAQSARPGLYVCPDDGYREHAEVFEKAGLGRIMALPECKTLGRDRDELFSFMRDFLATGSIKEAAGKFFSCNAADAIVDDIIRILNRAKNAL